MASGDTSTCSSNCVAFAASCASVVVASLQAPKVTSARNSLPVSFDVRWTKPVRRAAASMASDAKKSVNMETALCVPVVMGVSLVWGKDATGNPSYHRGETSTARDNLRGYRFMRMRIRGATRPPLHRTPDEGTMVTYGTRGHEVEVVASHHQDLMRREGQPPGSALVGLRAGLVDAAHLARDEAIPGDVIAA